MLGTKSMQFRDATRRGNAFIGTATLVSGGNRAHVQLMNPVGSGKTLEVSAIHLYTVNGGGPFRLTFHNIELTTDVGAGSNKLSGGAASVAHLRSQANVTILGGTEMFRVHIPTAMTFSAQFDSPILLPEGTGLMTVNETAGYQTGAAFEWMEFPS